MKLTDLEPRWLTPNLLLFICPHCRKDRLTCKNVVMSRKEQYTIYAEKVNADWNMSVVPCKPEMDWTFSGSDFATLTVTPSIDASASGHWHGFITNGEIR